MAADCRPYGFARMVHSKVQGQDTASSLATKVSLVSSHGQPCDISLLVRGMAVVCQVVATGTPSISSIHRNVEDWLRCASAIHNYSRDMNRGGTQSPYQHLGDEGSSFDLNAFRNWVMGESMVLMNDNDTVVVYMRNSHLVRLVCNHSHCMVPPGEETSCRPAQSSILGSSDQVIPSSSGV